MPLPSGKIIIIIMNERIRKRAIKRCAGKATEVANAHVRIFLIAVRCLAFFPPLSFLFFFFLKTSRVLRLNSIARRAEEEARGGRRGKRRALARICKGRRKEGGEEKKTPPHRTNEKKPDGKRCHTSG